MTTVTDNNASREFSIRKVTGVMNGVEYEKVWLEGYHGEGKTVHVPEGVTHIRADVFTKNGNIISVHFPSTVKEMKAPFSECESLAEVYFHGSEVIKFAHGIFSGLTSPITVVFEGTSETFLRAMEPYTESEGYYDSGSNGGAPGFYLTYYRNTPMAHPLDDRFYITVRCLADGKSLTLHGKHVESRYAGQSSPYGN